MNSNEHEQEHAHVQVAHRGILGRGDFHVFDYVVAMRFTW